ncbi:hypothetical protein ANN_03766 [Periplaneta americana]|uniref:Mariner Mos1 transposase n=1 Tax=Periplaneta americana TaxID=6978 RepID=A0ABQ8TZU4_PERAM|nr:hypothetical protein ANN_03766 [Periplaneta americana]
MTFVPRKKSILSRLRTSHNLRDIAQDLNCDRTPALLFRSSNFVNIIYIRLNFHRLKFCQFVKYFSTTSATYVVSKLVLLFYTAAIYDVISISILLLLLFYAADIGNIISATTINICAFIAVYYVQSRSLRWQQHRRNILFANDHNSHCYGRSSEVASKSRCGNIKLSEIFICFSIAEDRTKFKQTLSVRKVICTVFWDRKGILLIDFLPRGKTVNADRYCETLRKLRRAIQNKRRGMLTAGVVLLRDNARPHTARRTAAVLTEFEWKLFDHPPYSPDLAPSDFHVFLHLKKFLSSGERFGNDEERRRL